MDCAIDLGDAAVVCACAPEAVLARHGVRACESWLDPREHLRMQLLARPEDRRAYVAAHALLRFCLSEALGCAPGHVRLAATASGRPLLADSCAAQELHISLSRRRTMVACAWSRVGACGVDVEQIGQARHPLSVATSYFAPAEAQWIAEAEGAERSRRFVALWTLKEACLKAEGEGLAGGLARYAFVPPVDLRRGTVSPSPPAHGTRLHYVSRWFEDGHALAFAFVDPI